MNEMKCALRKDFMECFRRKKFLIFMLSALGMGLLIYACSMVLPVFVQAIIDIAPEFISGAESMEELMRTFFPEDVKGNISLLSSNIMVFYVIIIVILSYRLLPKEFDKGRWDMPISCGYKPETLIVSKALVYGLMSAVPVFVTYLLYYFFISMVLRDNLGFGNALMQAFLNFLCIFIIMVYTIFGSAMFKYGIVNAISVISITLFAPDIFSFFNFEKYVPTYVFNFVKYAQTNYKDVVGSILILIILGAMYGVWAVIAYRKRHR